MKVLDERKMGAVLVRWRLVCGMGLKKRKVMASGQRRSARRLLGKTCLVSVDIIIVMVKSMFDLKIY